jgi:hypothetical protein
MNPDECARFDRRVREILDEHPEAMSEDAIIAELRRRDFVTAEMEAQCLEEGLLMYLSDLLARRVFWTELPPRQMRRPRPYSRPSPIVRKGVLCDRDGRELCTVTQDAAGEVYFPEPVEAYMRQVLDAYPPGSADHREAC